jgi:aldehyde dehydrogenase (NAD+)
MFLGPAKTKIVYEPLGVVCIMGSWNFPLFTTLLPLVGVIAAGNCAVVKPSEIAPHSLRKIKSLFARFLDTSSYSCIEGQVEVARTLTSSKFDMICFTGSTEKGKLVAQAAGQNLVPCVLELGGKSPAVVDETADIDLAAKKIVMGRFMNAGQVCISPDYVLVHYRVTERFMAALERAVNEQLPA